MSSGARKPSHAREVRMRLDRHFRHVRRAGAVFVAVRGAAVAPVITFLAVILCAASPASEARRTQGEIK